MPSLLVTGFPGTLATDLLPRLLEDDDDATATCIVRPRLAATARARAVALADREPRLMGRIRLVEGDITRPGLGVSAVDAALLDETTELFHLAALHDLSARRDRLLRVNVGGTREVLAAANGMPQLTRVHYVSTCLVSGRYPGLFTEEDLDRGQRFHNAYEESRYLAELEAQIRMMNGAPVTIYRPSIVGGESATGATPVYDGPYYLIRWVLQHRRVAFLPMPPEARRARPNLVPRDLLVDAIAWLARRPHSLGRVYQLADPRPPTLDAALDVIAEASGRRLVRVPVPGGAITRGLARAGFGGIAGLPGAMLAYLSLPATYATARTQADLAGSGIVFPRFETWLRRMVEFTRRSGAR